MHVRRHEGNTNPVPSRATKDAAGFDLTYFGEPKIIQPGERFLAPTGFDVQLPAYSVGFVTPRSGLAAKHGLTVLNAPGTIDADYNGEIKVILINHSDVPYTVQNGDRVAQLVILNGTFAGFPVATEVSELETTARGQNGFGSTGK